MTSNKVKLKLLFCLTFFAATMAHAMESDDLCTKEIHADNMMHDFLYHPSKFKANWETKTETTHILPKDVIKIIIGTDFAPALSMLKKEVSRLFFSYNNSTNDNATDYSSLGTLVATACNDKTAKIWNAKSGKLIHVIKHPDEVRTVSFSPDGALLTTTANKANTAKIWNIKDILEALEFLKGLSLEHAFLLNCLYHVALQNKLLAKKRLLAEHKLDFNRFRHLQEYFDSFPMQLQRVLGNYIKRITI